MKILITTEFFLPLRCGVTTAVLNQRTTLELLGHEVRILTIGRNKKSYFKNGVYYIRNNLPQFYKDSYSSIAFHDPLVREAIHWKPDIVHAQCEFFTMRFAIQIAKKCKCPLFHTCHTDFESYGIHFTKNKRLWHWCTSTFIPKCIKKVNYTICPTDKLCNLLKSYHIGHPLAVLAVGLDLDRFFQILPEEKFKFLREQYGLTENEIVLVSVCRLSEEKNVGETIFHFKALLQSHHMAKLLIVGGGTAKPQLEAQVQELCISDNVIFTDSIPMEDIWQYYKIGDIFVSSSQSETQGLTYIEALASSLPIVCRKDDVLSVSLIENVNGYSFTTEDEFLEHIIPLMDSPTLREQFSEAAKCSVEKFSLLYFGTQLERLYTIALDEHWVVGKKIPNDSHALLQAE